MPGASKRSFNTPDERIDLPGITAEAIEIGDTTVSRSVFQPGTHCSRISYDGLPTCDAHHSGYAVDGMLHVEMLDGSVLDVGPNRPTSFHVVGGQFDTVYKEGTFLLRNGRGPLDPPGTTTGGSQALDLAAAQGGFVELSFPEPGRYPVVNHVMVDAERGARGIVEVTGR